MFVSNSDLRKLTFFGMLMVAYDASLTFHIKIFNKKTRKLGKHADLDSMSELSSLSTWSKQINRHKEVMHKSQSKTCLL